MFTEEVRGLDEVRVGLFVLSENLKEGVAEAVYTTARDVQLDIQLQMPVDTGWAQARYGEPAYGGEWTVKDGGLTIEFGSDIAPYEYIIRLNEGSSKQAPAGFIDVAAERGEGRLEYAIDVQIAKWTDK